jgi:Rhodopirellula transposase DDE domain
LIAYFVRMSDSDPISERFASLSPHLDERGRRLFAATEARSAGYGGVATVSRITGIAASVPAQAGIGRGLRELAANIAPEAGRLRRPGGGRKPLVATDPGLLPALLTLVEPTQRGDPTSALRWTCKSLRRLAAELTAQGHPVSRTVVGELLAQQNFSLQANSKTREGGEHPDRDAQFLHIDQSVTEALAAKQPVISVDTKKKELVGDPRVKPVGMLQECRPGMAAEGGARGGSGA